MDDLEPPPFSWEQELLRRGSTREAGMLTPERARQLLLNRAHKGKWRTEDLVGYANRLREGTFPDWTTIEIDARGCLLNGAHRCFAVLATGVSVPVFYRVQRSRSRDKVSTIEMLTAERAFRAARRRGTSRNATP